MTTSNRIGGGRGAAFHFSVDGERVEAYAGETIAGAMLAAGRRSARRTTWRGEPRGTFCLMGVCHDCRMVVDGVPNVRTCQTAARAGMVVVTQSGFGPVPQVDAPDAQEGRTPERRGGVAPEGREGLTPGGCDGVAPEVTA